MTPIPFGQSTLAVVSTLFLVQRVSVFWLGQALDILPPCGKVDCDTGTQIILLAYRFLAGN